MSIRKRKLIINWIVFWITCIISTVLFIIVRIFIPNNLPFAYGAIFGMCITFWIITLSNLSDYYQIKKAMKKESLNYPNHHKCLDCPKCMEYVFDIDDIFEFYHDLWKNIREINRKKKSGKNERSI